MHLQVIRGHCSIKTGWQCFSYNKAKINITKRLHIKSLNQLKMRTQQAVSHSANLLAKQALTTLDYV